jgi:hypothetical protein
MGNQVVLLRHVGKKKLSRWIILLLSTKGNGVHTLFFSIFLGTEIEEYILNRRMCWGTQTNIKDSYLRLLLSPRTPHSDTHTPHSVIQNFIPTSPPLATPSHRRWRCRCRTLPIHRRRTLPRGLTVEPPRDGLH